MELVKVEPCNWPTLFDCPDATAMTSPLPDPAYDNIHKPITLRLTTASDPEQGRKKNWDRMVMDEIDDSKSGDSGDPVSHYSLENLPSFSVLDRPLATVSNVGPTTHPLAVIRVPSGPSSPTLFPFLHPIPC